MTKEGVSKARARKTRTRERQAVRSGAGQRPPLLRSPVMGVLIVFVLWVLVMFVLRAPALIRHWTEASVLLPMISDAVFALAGLFAGAVFLEHIRPEFLRRNSRLVLMSLSALGALVLTVLLQATAVELEPIQPVIKFLLPYAFAPLLLTIMLGTRAALVTGLWTALVMSLLVDRSVPVLVQGVIATAVAMHTVRRVRKRSRVIKAGALVGLAHVACVLGTTVLDWTVAPDLTSLLHQAVAGIAAGLVSGVVCAILVLLLLPVLEHIFAITSDISLLELSDLSHPLLQRLALEAPGTYHHSLVVANLAQAAADAIGANSLEARVCAYFHDIGKLTKPDFFAENIHLRPNPHDDLPPSMSALVISAHVKEGISLAMHYKLPNPVLAAIREHHGSSMISYFHQKARAQLELDMDGVKGGARQGGARVDEGSFRYPGPRPSTRVSAIICLADAVEAAARSLDKPGPTHLEGLLNTLVRARLDDGQLDDCDLRMSDLNKIKRAFAFTLTTMYHGRIPYPKDEPEHKQSTTPPAGGDGRPGAADPVAAGTDRPLPAA